MLPMILGLMLTMPGAQAAPDYSFRELVNDCRTAIRSLNAGSSPMTPVEELHIGFCFGYLRGAVDFTYLDTTMLACVPTTVTADELARVIVKVADLHPDLLHEPMHFGVGVALVSTYPCAKGKAD